MRRRVALLWVLVLAPLALWGLLPLFAGADKASRIQHRIERKRSQVSHLRAREGVLTSTISAQTSRIRTLQARQNVLEADLARKRAELERIQAELRRQRARLARLRARLASARVVLGRRLVELYQADRPDIITVILNSRGFADLLERSEFMRRINEQDTKIITAVRVAKDRAKKAADRLAELEERQQRITSQVEAQRNEVASVKNRLANARAARAATLRSVRGQRQEAQEDLASLEREQARITGALRGAAGPIRRGSGNFIWPVNGPITGVFGENRGDHFHSGIDISASSGTPIRAADSGTVQLAGWQGGYGNFTCIGHGGGISTCYGHQSSIGVGVGQSVSQGQVIGAVGSTGHSTGPHLHFEVRVNGSPVNPLNYL